MDLQLLHLMEDFVLKEVDYSQQHGYSGRAKRYMRRKLTNEISSFLENIESETETESESDDDNDNAPHENDTDDNAPHENDTSDENTFNKMIQRDYKTIHNRIDLCFLMTYLIFLGSIYASTAYIIFSYKHIQIYEQYLNNSISHSESCL